MAGYDAASTKGIWWKSFLLAWLLTHPVGWAVAAIGASPPDAVGFVVLGVAWLLSFLGLRHRAQQRPATTVRAPLKLMQHITVAYAVATVAFGMVVDALRRDDTVPSAGLAPLPAAAVLAVTGALIVVTLAAGAPPLRSGEEDQVVAHYHSRFLMRIGLAELPALAAFVAVLLTGAPAVYLVGLIASLAGFFLVMPTAGRIRTDETRLSETGGPPDVLRSLTHGTA